jgi:adenylate cyclase
MGKEIERKFLVDHDKWNRLDKPAPVHYRQGYLLNDDNRSVRIRIAEKKAYITLKSSGSSARSRNEFEYEIPIADGKQLLQIFTTNGTEKNRYRIPKGEFTWEVDEFLGDNQGLIVAEIELKSEQDKFEKPDWIGAEVTEDTRYANSSLAVRPFKDWRRH